METSSIAYWNWAIRNVSCSSTRSNENIKLNLLPKAEVSISNQKVFYCGLVYNHKVLQKKRFKRAKLKKLPGL